MQTILSAKISPRVPSDGCFSPEQKTEVYTRSIFNEELMDRNSQFWKEHTNVARNCPFPDCTWCKMRFSPSRPGVGSVFLWKKRQPVWLALRSPKHVYKSKRLTACNFSMTATTRIPIR